MELLLHLLNGSFTVHTKVVVKGYTYYGLTSYTGAETMIPDSRHCLEEVSYFACFGTLN